MIQLTEPQVWTLMAVLSASMLGMMGLLSTWFLRVLRAEIGGLRGEIGGLRGEIGGELGGLRAEIGGLHGEMKANFERVDATMSAKFDQLNGKMDHLDLDVRVLFRRVFPDAS